MKTSNAHRILKSDPRIFMASACLLGIPTRYNGTHKRDEAIVRLSKKYVVIPFCPEVLAGLPIPRIPCCFYKNRVITQDKDKNDLTPLFERGAKLSLYLARILKPEKIFLKEKSPSCGVNKVYYLRGKKIILNKGQGIASRYLKGEFSIEPRDP